MNHSVPEACSKGTNSSSFFLESRSLGVGEFQLVCSCLFAKFVLSFGVRSNEHHRSSKRVGGRPPFFEVFEGVKTHFHAF